ncbi:MAG: AbrB/MazE/SpoVT family DNA-binding domain-containing protein [Lewinella sp.]|nr:AbrB/MazE/SpoVT family DNA-binding domain-containing protein [Lewinella sp.]
MILKLNKWGNSLGLRIPSHLATRFNLVEGISVGLEEHTEGLLIKPLPRQLSLDYLLEGMTEENQHPDFFTIES